MGKNLGKAVRQDQGKLREQKERPEVRQIKDMKPAPDPAMPQPEPGKK